MNKRDLNRRALGRLVGKTLHPAILVKTRTSPIRHVVTDEVEKCRYKLENPTHKVVSVQIWLEESRNYGGPLVYFMGNDATPMTNQSGICRSCRDNVRYFAHRTLWEQNEKRSV